VNDFVKKWREPVEVLLRETEALVVESCQGLISHNVKGCGKLAARFKTEVGPMLQHPCRTNPYKSLHHATPSRARARTRLVLAKRFWTTKDCGRRPTLRSPIPQLGFRAVLVL